MVIAISPVTATSVATPEELPTIILAEAIPCNFVSAIAAEAFISALTIVPSTIIVLVTVPVSPDVITVPVTSGKVIVLSDVVGSATARVIS